MNSAAPYTPDQARKDYPPRLRRGSVIELGKRFGLSEHSMRQLMEGAEAPIRRVCFGRQSRGYFGRDQVLEVIG